MTYDQTQPPYNGCLENWDIRLERCDRAVHDSTFAWILPPCGNEVRASCMQEATVGDAIYFFAFFCVKLIGDKPPEVWSQLALRQNRQIIAFFGHLTGVRLPPRQIWEERLCQSASFNQFRTGDMWSFWSGKKRDRGVTSTHILVIHIQRIIHSHIVTL